MEHPKQSDKALNLRPLPKLLHLETWLVIMRPKFLLIVSEPSPSSLTPLRTVILKSTQWNLPSFHWHTSMTKATPTCLWTTPHMTLWRPWLHLSRLRQSHYPGDIYTYFQPTKTFRTSPALTRISTQGLPQKLFHQSTLCIHTRLQNILVEFHNIFSKSDYDLGWTDLISHEIKMSSTAPVYTKQFRIPVSHQQIITKFVDDMLDKQLIKAARMRYNSPIFCIRKKNGSWRPVIDLHCVNANTLKDAYSVKDIQTCLDSIGAQKSAVFSSIDLKSGFLQQNLKPDSCPFTGFTIPGRGQYQFKVSCFGSTGAPSSFSKLMDTILHGLSNSISYIDDILIYSLTHQHHLQDLRCCFNRLRDNNLKVSIEKSTFGSDSGYLCFHIDASGMRPGMDKLQGVQDFPPPSSVCQICQFIGLASFFRKHIPNFMKLRGILTALTRKNSEWNSMTLPTDPLIAFCTLQKSLFPPQRSPTPEMNCRFYSSLMPRAAQLMIMANKSFQAASALPWCNNGLKIKSFESSLYYSAFMLELAAVHFGIKKFHHYLYGGKPFKVFSDHKLLETLNKMQTKTIIFKKTYSNTTSNSSIRKIRKCKSQNLKS